MRERIQELLETVFRVRANEAHRAGLMFLYLMCVVGTFVVGRTVRDTLFLSRYEVAVLPYMYIAVALGVSASSYLYSRVAQNRRREDVVFTALAGFSVVTLAAWLILIVGLAGTWFYPSLYVWVEIVGSISIIQFWTFANEIYSAREAKRLFGFIGAGGVVASIFGGFAIGSVVPWLGSDNLLALCAGLLGLSAVFMRKVARTAKAELDEAARKPRRSRIGLSKDSGALLHSRHLKFIAAIVVVTFLTVTIVDYQFKLVAKTTYREAALASYFGFFYGCTGLVSAVVQLFLTSRILERGGIGVSLLVLPAGLALGTVSMAFVPMVPMMLATTLAKGAENIFRYTVNDATTQLLYVPVPPQQRARAKAFIDGILKPLSIGLAGLLIVGASRLFDKAQLATDLAWLDAALIAGWITLVLMVRGEYVKSLISTLDPRRIELAGPWTPLHDEATVTALKKSMAAGDEPRILAALEMIVRVKADFSADLLPLLKHDSPAVRRAAVELLGRYPKKHGAIEPLTRDTEPKVRAAALVALAHARGQDAAQELTASLKDPSHEVRAAVAGALLRQGDHPLAKETFLKLLAHEDPLAREACARTLKIVPSGTLHQAVATLMSDPDARVRSAAVEAAIEDKNLELVPSLLAALADAGTSSNATRALILFGPAISDALFSALEDDTTPPGVRRNIPRIIADWGEQDAVTRLVRVIDTDDRELRIAVAKAASKIRERTPGIAIEETRLDKEIRFELRAAYQSLATALDLELPSSDLLIEALRVRSRTHLGLAFRLLQIRYPARTIALVYSNLDSENKALRANALEVVDNLLSKDESRLLVPLLEDLDDAGKVARGGLLFPIQRNKAEHWVERLLDDPEPWMASCALARASTTSRFSLFEKIGALTRAKDPLVRETACVALLRMLRADDSPWKESREMTNNLQQIARIVATDERREVQKVGVTLASTLANVSL